MAPFFASSFQPHTHHGLTDMHVVRHDGSRTVRKDVQRPFRPPSLCAQSQKMIESEHFSFMPGGLFRAHLLVVMMTCMHACMLAWGSNLGQTAQFA